MSKIIYVLTNPAMPNLVKIGIAGNLKERIRTLSNTSVPDPFEVHYACTVKDAVKTEKAFHSAFFDYREKPNREFFRIEPERVSVLLKLLEIEDVTPHQDYTENEEKQQLLDNARKRRDNFDFKSVGIAPGTVLYLMRDDAVKVTVVDEKKVQFEDGEPMSISAAARKAINAKGELNGTCYWAFEGETLNQRRERIENEESDE